MAKKSTTPNLRAKNESDRRLLVAATEGDTPFLESICRASNSKHPGNGESLLRNAVCVSGCHLLHWAAGSNQVAVLEYLLSPRENTNSSSADEKQEKSESETTTTIEKDNHSITSNGCSGRSTVGSPSAIFHDTPSHRAIDLPVTRCKKSLGRTPLHYACRNGCLEAVRWLVDHGASVGVHAKQSVTPFQLAVWQNRFEICRFLVERGGHDASKDFNDFGCGAVHWLGIAPVARANAVEDEDSENASDDSAESDEGRNLIPLAKWLSTLPGIDFGARQRQNHTALHKASWGGHLALVRYLHEEHDMWDDVADFAGNYAASLADMANTPKHNRIAKYLRHHCSRKRAESLAVLGLLDAGGNNGSKTFGKGEIRRAYLAKARQLHPDRLLRATNNDQTIADENKDDCNVNVGVVRGEVDAGETSQKTNDHPGGESMNSGTSITFDELRKAYIHLIEEDGVGDQSNPAHSLNLMLQYVNNSYNNNKESDNGTKVNQIGNDDKGEEQEEDDSFFKARLVAVLLEYGDKGIDLSNVKKKWKQVWPKVPFPSQHQERQEQQQARKIPMAEFLMQRAGDVIRFERHGDRNRRVLVLLRDKNSCKETVLQSGSTSVAAATGVAATETDTTEVSTKQ